MVVENSTTTDEEKETAPVYTPGVPTEDSKKALATETQQDPFDILDQTMNTLTTEMVLWGTKMGYSAGNINLIIGQFERAISEDLDKTLLEGNQNQQLMHFKMAEMGQEFNAVNFVNTFDWFYSPEGQDKLVDNAWGVIQNTWSGLGDRGSVVKKATGTGSRRATPTEIRNRFDLDRLANGATDIWRVMLLEEHPNPKKLASDYVEAMVATRGEKAIDFETFVKEKAKKTARSASIFRNKPEAESHEQYIQRYYQSAQNVLRPGNAAEVAIGGAQFGADAATFQARLGRSNEAKTSAPYINSLGEKMSAVKELFKG